MSEKEGNENKETKKQLGTALTAISLITEIGFTMVANVLVGFLLGMYLDRWFNTVFIFLLIGILLGVMSGFRMVYLLIMKVEKRGGKK